MMAISSEAPTSLNVISYNCLGLKYISHYRRERLAEIGRQLALASPVPEIVGLQECWAQEDYQSIRKQTKHILPYGKYYYSGIFGGGLAILSKWPIEESTQAWEIAKLMRGAAERGHLVLGLGDFNMVPRSFAHQLVTGYAFVQDAWRALHPESSIGAANDDSERSRGREIPTARYNLSENGATCDGVLNTWRWSKEQQKKQYKGGNIIVDDTTPDPRAKRLDYIFIGDDNHVHSPSDNKWQVQEIRVGMTERHPLIGCSLSDHFSVEASFSREASPADNPLNTGQAGSEILTAKHIAIDSLSNSTFDTILFMIENYTRRERHQRRFRLFHFGISIFVAISCFIAIWWSPRPFVAFLLILLSTLGFGSGVIDGLIGGLFIGSELRALKEFEWEIQNAKDIAQGRRGGGQENVSKEHT